MAATEMYTRGQPGETDNRGESLVAQHLDRMQQQKEQVAMDKLRQLMPQMGDVVRALALSKSEWDIDQAVSMLRSFQVTHLDKVNALNKKRKKLREAMEACTGEEEPGQVAAAPSGSDSGKSGGGGDSASSSSSSGSSSSEDEQEDKKRKRSSSSRKDSRKHKKHSKSKKDSKRSKKHKRSSRDKDKDGLKDGGDKQRRKRKAADSSDEEQAGDAAKHRKLGRSDDVGKYGFIREGDFAAKNAEFMLWATEVKGANVELLGRLEEKELFKEYMEDFNTGTLKHRKYYNLEAYELDKAAKARAKAAKGAGGKDKGKDGGAAAEAFDARTDEEEMRKQRQEARMRFQQDRLVEAYNLLKHTDRAKDMREQELLRAEMTLAYKTGDRARAQKLFERLQPDDQKK